MNYPTGSAFSDSASSSYSGASADRQFNVYLALSQYPVLCDRIRARMRQELFERGITTPQQFEAEARAYSIQSQEREGLRNPFGEEAAQIWESRLFRVREILTDQVFSRHLSFELFEQLGLGSAQRTGHPGSRGFPFDEPRTGSPGNGFPAGDRYSNAAPIRTGSACRHG